MRKTWQARTRIGAAILVVALAMGENVATAGPEKSVFFGRWAVSDLKDKFSANGKLYRVMDFVPCGKQMCGISVDGGVCGVTLFRVPVPSGDSGFGGQTRWGNTMKLMVAKVMGAFSDNILTIEVGDKDAHLGSRNSVPTYVSDYHKIGKAACAADGPAM